MTNPGLWLLLLILALMVLSLLWLYWYLARNVLNPKGRGSAKKTAKILKGFARFRGFRVLSDIRLDAGGQEVYIENMLIGFFGILLVHTCGARGEYYGRVEGKDWTLMQNDDKSTFPNPLLEQEKAIAALRALFSKNKVFKVPMEHHVYISSQAKKTGVFITNDGQILLGGRLKGYLNKTKFEKDTGLDVQRVASLIEENRIKN